ncbi:hypothetical protein [Clostridium sp.]|uniref:hypothetical protein n=1 Tax=Clostridium sp. TaxID=1506 RepID=UPI0032177F99
MSKIVEYLKEINLDNKDRIKNYIWNTSPEELLILIEHLRKLIKEDYVVKKYNPFTFVPTSELSGSTGCASLDCRIKRANKFAIFSSLYAEDVYIQLNLITNSHQHLNINKITKNKEVLGRFLHNLESDILILNSYAKLIEAGIVHITPPTLAYCKDCFNKEILGQENSINIDPIKQLFLNKAKLYVHSYNKNNDLLYFEVENMDEVFPEHTPLFPISPKKFNLSNFCFETGSLITNTDLINDFIENITKKEFISASYSAHYCKNNNAKLITNKISDSMFMNLANQKSKHNYGLDCYNVLPQYDMPFVTDITIEKALQLREVEGESFNKYRIALNKSISEQHKTNSQLELCDIYDDILFPAFSELDMKLKNIRNGFYKKTFYEIAIVGTVISAGIYTGIVPTHTTDILKSVGIGTGAAISIAHQIFSKAPGKDTLKEHDYYFLWQLKKDIDKNRKSSKIII